jgi:hypothetical protein
MKRKATLHRLTYSGVFDLFDKLEDAQTNLEGTLGVLSKLIDHDVECDAGVIVTMERHLKADFANLDAMITRTREEILPSLRSGRTRNLPEEATPAAEGTPAVSLAVDNNGGDHDAA